MPDRNYTTLTMKKHAKRRDRRTFAIIAIFVLGAGLVALSFGLRDEESDMPEAPETRSITAHASAGRIESGNVPPGPQEAAPMIPNPAQSPGAENPVRTPDSGVRTAKTPPKTADAPDKPRHAAAMADFARIPTQPGAVAPKIGHYRIRETPVAYDATASPEEILRNQATRYTVVSGDIIGRIAQKHGCTVGQIQKANRMTGDKIKIGQKLLIPNCDENAGNPQNAPAPATGSVPGTAGAP